MYLYEFEVKSLNEIDNRKHASGRNTHMSLLIPGLASAGSAKSACERLSAAKGASCRSGDVADTWALRRLEVAFQPTQGHVRIETDAPDRRSAARCAVPAPSNSARE